MKIVFFVALVFPFLSEADQNWDYTFLGGSEKEFRNSFEGFLVEKDVRVSFSDCFFSEWHEGDLLGRDKVLKMQFSEPTLESLLASLSKITKWNFSLLGGELVLIEKDDFLANSSIYISEKAFEKIGSSADGVMDFLTSKGIKFSSGYALNVVDAKQGKKILLKNSFREIEHSVTLFMLLERKVKAKGTARQGDGKADGKAKGVCP